MSGRSVLNNFNCGFLVCGIGCINYGRQRNYKTNGIFYLIRFLLICEWVYIMNNINRSVMAMIYFILIVYILIQIMF